MDYYIDPRNESKESFLETRGVAVPDTFKWSDTPKGSLPVILINNGFFTAAGIAYSEAKFNAFTGVDDRRPKQFYTVSVEALLSLDDSDIAKLVEELNLAA